MRELAKLLVLMAVGVGMYLLGAIVGERRVSERIVELESALNVCLTVLDNFRKNPPP